jgi:hypothetical protein
MKAKGSNNKNHWLSKKIRRIIKKGLKIQKLHRSKK